MYLADIARGDAAAFGRWLASAERPVRLSLRSFAAHTDTEAVLQEALLRVWQVAGRVEPDGRPNALLRFALRTARNAALTELRRRRAPGMDPEALERAVDDHSLQEAPASPDPLLRTATLDCIEQLPEKPREALLARTRSSGSEPDEQLAAGLSMRTNTFLQNFTRARRALAECLEGKGIAIRELP